MRIDGYRFFFFSNEGNESPHIHIQQAEKHAKFWLQPLQLATNSGYTGREMTRIGTSLDQHRDLLLEAWDEFFNR